MDFSLTAADDPRSMKQITCWVIENEVGLVFVLFLKYLMNYKGLILIIHNSQPQKYGHTDLEGVRCHATQEELMLSPRESHVEILTLSLVFVFPIQRGLSRL